MSSILGSERLDGPRGESRRGASHAGSVVESVLVFRIGSLGDTLISVPALWAVREHFPGARITLLYDDHPGKGYVRAEDLLKGSGAVDDFLAYPVRRSRPGKLLSMGRLLASLRRRRFPCLIYLAPTGRSADHVARDRKFFSMSGIGRVLGMDSAFDFPVREPGGPLPVLASEADIILSRLADSGIAVPPPGRGRMDLGLGEAERRQVERWREGLPADGGRAWLAVGPGSKMPAKRWPEDRFREVVARLIGALDVWPVVFGGPEDRAAGDRLVRAWGRGANAAGMLGPRASAAALGLCRSYLGNDTGTMHLAVAAGLKCVALFSSRSYVGLWYPYGEGHRVLRTPIACEGCELVECLDRDTECLKSIGVDEVYRECLDLLGAPQSAG